MVHNELENANKKPQFFVPMFIKILINKGHTYIYDNDEIDNLNNKDLLEKRFFKRICIKC